MADPQPTYDEAPQAGRRWRRRREKYDHAAARLGVPVEVRRRAWKCDWHPLSWYAGRLDG